MPVISNSRPETQSSCRGHCLGGPRRSPSRAVADRAGSGNGSQQNCFLPVLFTRIIGILVNLRFIYRESLRRAFILGGAIIRTKSQSTTCGAPQVTTGGGGHAAAHVTCGLPLRGQGEETGISVRAESQPGRSSLRASACHPRSPAAFAHPAWPGPGYVPPA